MAVRLRCEDPSEFDVQLERAAQTARDSAKPLFILFTGAVVPETGRSWCPDCVKADPVINKVLHELEGGGVLLECPVVRAEYREPEYAYRTNQFKLACVPTLIKWENKKISRRLNDDQSQDEDLVRELMA